MTTHKTEEKDFHYDTLSEFGLAVGSSSGSNRATLVYIPRKGTRAWERHDVSALKMVHKGAATEIEKQELAPVIGGHWSSITFQSAVPKTGDLSAPPTDDFRPGTLGFSDHGIQPRATRPTSSADPTADQPDLTEPPTRRLT